MFFYPMNPDNCRKTASWIATPSQSLINYEISAISAYLLLSSVLYVEPYYLVGLFQNSIVKQNFKLSSIELILFNF